MKTKMMPQKIQQHDDSKSNKSFSSVTKIEKHDDDIHEIDVDYA